MYGSFFAFIGNCVAFPIKAKSAPRRSHCGGTEFVASRPAAGGESCSAGFYFHAIGNCAAFPIKAKSAPRRSHCGGTEFVASRPAAGGESCSAGFYFCAIIKENTVTVEKTYTVTKEREWKKPLVRSFFTHPVCDERHKHGVYGRQKIVCTIFCRSVAQSAPERGRHEVL